MASILLVDDNDEFRTILAKVLTQAGFEVQEASGGRQALELYGIHPTDIVIADLVMPDTEGLEMIVEFKRLYAPAKIIAISGEARTDSKTSLKMAKALGARRALAKPFSDLEILAAVNEVLQEP